ncbi:DUF3667 domain-containing protein [Pedobacter sp. KBS0701]|uniref:DUF3667 domain-containing protein n=1 Tax=unclassified Pedobacter TaxID=2628915 RepID=UPI00110F1341|nr:DUF3667 domain-containing protein [Pedobacter sp. KBS0701]QDW24001.1 DUF3667 domain-containing protein [Pedobacter sp. KBS0701]
MSSDCLNCTAPVTQNFCPNCGQKSSTHRYSIKHFLAHDFVHGIWHVDKGILFTLKALFTRPGHSVREFIQGKRVPYFSFVTLILLILTASSLIAPFTHGNISDLMPQGGKAAMSSTEKFISEHPKLILIVAIPFYSLLSFLWFRKAKLNYSEHLVLNSNRVIVELVMGLLISVVTIFYTDSKLIVFLYGVVLFLGLFYSIWFYYQFFSAFNYSKTALILRSILVPVSYNLFTLILGIVFAIISKH